MLIKQDSTESKNESTPEFTFFSIDCDSDTLEINPVKSESVS